MSNTPGETPQFNPMGPKAYGTTPAAASTGPSTPTPTPTPTPKKRNTLGIVALVVAILGFVFAVMEGAYIVGWLLLPIGFVLALVAMFQRHQPKGLAVAALVVTIVGTIAGAVAFMGSVGRAFESASGGKVTAAPVAGGSAPAAPAAPAGKDQGTRENPFPLGATVANQDWQVKVNSYNADATKEVLAANQFNDKPDEGMVYALVNVTVTRIATDEGSPMFEVGVDYVTAGGNVVTGADKLVVAPKPLSNNELFTGASATGNVVLQVPKGDAGLLRVKAGLFGDGVFVATK